MTWLAYLTLERSGRLVGAALYFRTGYSPVWTQNPSGGFPGTQVFRYDYACVNGLYRNRVEAYVIPPWPYVYIGPAPTDSASNWGAVLGC